MFIVELKYTSKYSGNKMEEIGSFETIKEVIDYIALVEKQSTYLLCTNKYELISTLFMQNDLIYTK